MELEVTIYPDGSQRTLYYTPITNLVNKAKGTTIVDAHTLLQDLGELSSDQVRRLAGILLMELHDLSLLHAQRCFTREHQRFLEEYLPLFELVPGNLYDYNPPNDLT